MTSIIQKINLFEKKYLASRIACLLLASVLLMYLLPVSTRGLVASLISGGLAFLLLVQFVFQNRGLNLLLGIILFFVGGYFSLAVVSEFNEFETITREAWLLLSVGLGLCISVMVLSVLMIQRSVLD